MTNNVYILVAWSDSIPLVRSYEDESEAIEALKDARPVGDSANLYKCSEHGVISVIEGW